MKIGIQAARIIDPSSDHHNSTANVLVENGRIVDISNKKLNQVDQLVQGKDLVLFPGFFDPFVQFWDPGFEHREDLESGGQAAAHGGFTHVGLMPDCTPCITSKSHINYITRNNGHQVTTLLPFGSISPNIEEGPLSEMMELHQAGAIGFSAGKRCIEDSGMLLRSLQYLLPIDGVVVQFPHDAQIAGSGWMNEGITAVKMGVKGIPNIAESLVVQRDLEILEYTNSKLHFSQISTAESVALIAKAKKKGLQVSASVSPWHLLFSEEDVIGYKTDFKILPPLRSSKDRKALIKGIKNGSIDFISSFHIPRHNDEKEIEFGLASYGTQGLESVLQVVLELLKRSLSEDEIYYALVRNARTIFGLDIPTIQKEANACFTCFDKAANAVTMNKAYFLSKSKRNPLSGKEITCLPKCTINGNQYQVY